MLLRHEATGASREGGGGGSPESEDLPRLLMTEPLAEGRIQVLRLSVLVTGVAVAAFGMSVAGAAGGDRTLQQTVTSSVPASYPVTIVTGNDAGA